MIRNWMVLLISLSLFSCKYKEKPEFVRVDRIDLGKISVEEIDFEADAVFTNGNDIGGQLFTENIDIYVDEILVGHVKTKEFNIPARDTFMIPLQGKISTEKILKKKGKSLLSNLLSIVSSKKVKVRFEGDILFKKGPFSYTYTVNQANEVDIKL